MEDAIVNGTVIFNIDGLFLNGDDVNYCPFCGHGCEVIHREPRNGSEFYDYTDGDE